jgi:hypothetical protein
MTVVRLHPSPKPRRDAAGANLLRLVWRGRGVVAAIATAIVVRRGSAVILRRRRRVGLSRLLAGVGRRIGIAGLRTGIIIAGPSYAGSPQKQRSKCDAGNGIKSHDHAILLVSQA